MTYFCTFTSYKTIQHFVVTSHNSSQQFLCCYHVHNSKLQTVFLRLILKCDFHERYMKSLILKRQKTNLDLCTVHVRKKKEKKYIYIYI